ncbi:hypothetical protein BH23GEM4_BH23GEM4_01680 [soil metagenome]
MQHLYPNTGDKIVRKQAIALFAAAALATTAACADNDADEMGAEGEGMVISQDTMMMIDTTMSTMEVPVTDVDTGMAVSETVVEADTMTDVDVIREP